MLDLLKIAACLIAWDLLERFADFGGYLATTSPKDIYSDFVDMLNS